MEFGSPMIDVKLKPPERDLGPDSRGAACWDALSQPPPIPRFSWRVEYDIKHGVSLTQPPNNNHQNPAHSWAADSGSFGTPAMRKSAI
jgi:hypothetical protein